MDKNEAINLAKSYIATIQDKYQIEKVILFGSYAKGTNHDDSDIDLAILLKNVEDTIETQIDLMCLRRDQDLIIEPHPFAIIDFNDSNPVVAEIKKNGIEIINHAA
jgi:predicted nucleotidyltransferase